MTFGFFSVFGLVAMLALVAGGVALLPALLAIGAVVLAFSLAFHVIGFVFRLFGVLLLAVVAIPLMLAVGGIALALGIAMLHLALPLIVVVGVIWLIAHHHKSQQPLRAELTEQGRAAVFCGAVVRAAARSHLVPSPACGRGEGKGRCGSRLPDGPHPPRGARRPLPRAGEATIHFDCDGMNCVSTASRSNAGGNRPWPMTKSLNACRLNFLPSVISVSARSSISLRVAVEVRGRLAGRAERVAIDLLLRHRRREDDLIRQHGFRAFRRDRARDCSFGIEDRARRALQACLQRDQLAVERLVRLRLGFGVQRPALDVDAVEREERSARARRRARPSPRTAARGRGGLRARSASTTRPRRLKSS